MASLKREEAVLTFLSKGEFLKAFMRMKIMVEENYQDQKKDEQGVASHDEGNKEAGGDEPSKTPLYSLSYLDDSLHSQF